MKIRVSKRGKQVAIYDTKSRSITTDDALLQSYVDEGVTTIRGGSIELEGEDAHWSGPKVTKTSSPIFWIEFVTRVIRDGYEVDDATIKELSKQR